MTLTPLQVPLGLAVPVVRAEPLNRLPGTAADDPFLRLAGGWLVGHPGEHRDRLPPRPGGLGQVMRPAPSHPSLPNDTDVDLWVRHLTTQPQPRTW